MLLRKFGVVFGLLRVCANVKTSVSLGVFSSMSLFTSCTLLASCSRRFLCQILKPIFKEKKMQKENIKTNTNSYN